MRRIIARTIGLPAVLAAAVLAPSAFAQSASTSISRGPGYYSRSTTVTAFDGHARSYSRNVGWGGGVYTDTRAYTGVNGGTGTRTITRNGGVVTNQFTGPHGNTRAYSRPARFRR